MKPLLRWIIPTLALLVVGPLAALPTAALRLSNGDHDTTYLITANPINGVFALLIALAAALALGALAAKLVDAKLGINAAALVLAWATMRTGNLGEVLAVSPAFIALLAESLAAVAAVVVLDAAINAASADKHASIIDDLKQLAANFPSYAPAILGGGITGLFAAWIVAFNALPGQALLAAILGSAVAAASANLALSAREDSAPQRTDVFAALVAALLAPVCLAVMPGLGSLAETARQSALTGPGAVPPIMWAAGVLLGVPIGRAWAHSSVEKGRRTAALT